MVSNLEKNLRKDILEASYKAGACHIGSALSCADIVEAIYEVKQPEDVFIFAKATGVAALYCYLHPIKKAWKYLKQYPLPSKEVPGVMWSGGSCGQGLSVAVGIALSKKLKGEKGKVYCLISDGELNEGQTYEATQFANHHKLNNLTVLVDVNGFQALGRTEDILKVDASGIKIDGHDRHAIKKALKLDFATGPVGLWCLTTKGRGVDFMEENNDWHYKNLDETRFKEAVLQVADQES